MYLALTVFTSVHSPRDNFVLGIKKHASPIHFPRLLNYRKKKEREKKKKRLTIHVRWKTNFDLTNRVFEFPSEKSKRSTHFELHRLTKKKKKGGKCKCAAHTFLFDTLILRLRFLSNLIDWWTEYILLRGERETLLQYNMSVCSSYIIVEES